MPAPHPSVEALQKLLKVGGSLGTYLARALGEVADAGGSKRRVDAAISFCQFTLAQGWVSRDPSALGDGLIEAYDCQIAASVGPSGLPRRRSACFDVVTKARALARKEGEVVGGEPKRRPFKQPRVPPDTIETRLSKRGQFGKYAAAALAARSVTGKERFPRTYKPYIRAYTSYLDKTDPGKKVRHSTDLDSENLKKYEIYLVSGQKSASYIEKSKLACRSLLNIAMELAVLDGEKVGEKIQHATTDDFPQPKRRAKQNAERIEHILRGRLIGQQISSVMYGRLAALRSGSVRFELDALTPLIKYIELKGLECISELTREHLQDLQDLIKAGRSERSAHAVWNAIRRVLNVCCKQEDLDHEQIVLDWPPANRLGIDRVRENTDQGLSPVDAARLERLCREDITAVLQRRETLGDLYGGPSLQELQPFEVLLAFRTGFNPGPLRSLELSDVTETEDRFEIAGAKARSRIQPVATFAVDRTPFGAPWLVDQIKLLTSTARLRARAEDRNHLFLFVSERGKYRGVVRPFGPQKGAWENAQLAKFGNQAGIEGLTLRTMRASFSNLAFAVSGDNVRVVQRVMAHQSHDMTESYSRRYNKAPRQEVLGHAMEQRLRDTRTRLKRDTRDQPTSLASAATPGFACIDPYSPPPELLQDGGMCAAYGACPDCPLAAIDKTSASSACELLLLADAIREFTGNIDADPRRLKFWSSQLDALVNVWLPQFPATTIAEAAQIQTVRRPRVEAELYV